jgi:hypothetical protein
MALIVRGSAPASVFQLAGTDENSATYGLGWALEKSLALRRALVHFLLQEDLDVTNAVIWLQKHGEDGGYTDLEIHAGQEFHLFIEAKKGWQVPKREQLLKYRPRLTASGARRQRIVSLSSAPAAFIANNLPADMDGVKVIHLSWRDVQRMATAARQTASALEEKVWLRQLALHMEEFVAMEKSTDNNVFVVSLGLDPMLDGNGPTWVDVVESDHSYFHPVGKTWPTQPPNYIGFRSSVAEDRRRSLRLPPWPADAPRDRGEKRRHPKSKASLRDRHPTVRRLQDTYRSKRRTQTAAR